MTQLDPEQLDRPGAGGGRNLTSDVTDDRLAAVLAIQQEITLREPSLDEVLELVARRSLIITGASGAAIALHREGEMSCRARSGAIAPPLRRARLCRFRPFRRVLAQGPDATLRRR